VSSLEREGARLDGQRGQLIAGIAQTEGKIVEAQLSVLQIDRDLFSEVAAEIRDLDGKIVPLEEDRVAAKDQLSRVIIASPQKGIVHQLTAKTVGGVIPAVETILQIIPTDDPIVVDTQVSPADIDQIKLRASALVRMTALNQRTTPELNGLVEQISPDAISDSRTGISYFQVRISISPGEMARLHGVPIVPGMPSEVFIKTGDRRVYEMLFKPLSDQLMRAYRQD
jgi:HlyD family secretion protein